MNDLNELKNALRQAIQAENEGHYFYKMAAASTSDEQGKKVFAELAEDELGHATYLKLNYDSIEKTGSLDADASLGNAPVFDSVNPIFSEKLLARIKDAHYEMTALSVAIQLEQSAQTFYRQQAEKTEDAALKRFFNELADWESKHYHALLKQQTALKEQYWQANRFSPM